MSHLSQDFRGEAGLAFGCDGFFQERDVLEDLHGCGRTGRGG